MLHVGTGLGSPWGAPALASPGGSGVFERDVKLGVLEDEFADRSMKLLINRVISVTKKVRSG